MRRIFSAPWSTLVLVLVGVLVGLGVLVSVAPWWWNGVVTVALVIAFSVGHSSGRVSEREQGGEG